VIRWGMRMWKPVIVASALFLMGCSDGTDNLMNVDDLAVGESPSGTNASSPNYSEEEDGIYSYIAAVSEEDQKQGKAAGSVLRFAYRGVQDGKHVLSLVDDSGDVVSTSECSKPCRIIKTTIAGSVMRQEYTPESLIGAAFQDALNGNLKVKPERTAQSARPPQPPEETSSVQAPASDETASAEGVGYSDEVEANEVAAE
jgi:hypothetical protein